MECFSGLCPGTKVITRGWWSPTPIGGLGGQLGWGEILTRFWETVSVASCYFFSCASLKSILIASDLSFISMGALMAFYSVPLFASRAKGVYSLICSRFWIRPRGHEDVDLRVKQGRYGTMKPDG